ncbi:hypothetical protein QS193_25135 [Escherichia coli]|nr:hypothetical protein [Escherichia coli]
MGVWGSPQTVSGSAQGAAGTVAARFFLENGEQKHAKDFEAAKEQCRIDNHGQNVNILSMIVQKRCFCLCLPQALYLEFRIEKAIYSMTFIFYFIENRITINNRSKIQNSFNVKRSLSFIPPLGTNLFSILSVINCNVP